MKAINFIFVPLLFSMALISCKTNNHAEDCLQKVLGSLEKIESATYTAQAEAWQPGDTTALSIHCFLTKEYDNPADSTIGASFVSFSCDEPAKFGSGYDGKSRFIVYHNKKKIVIDDFTARPLPFRPVTPPFFNYTKSIIQYALTTNDSIVVDLQEFDECYYFKLVINEDRQVEFFGKAYYMPENPYNSGETTSIYELWISKVTNLPYKVRREMSHDISVETVSNVELNKLSLSDFNIYAYFPADYEVRPYAYSENNVRQELTLVGEKAPDWTLNDENEQKIALSSLKGKVVLIQLTGIGCGPCQAAIPFLKELKAKYSEDKFELVAIETWMRKPPALRNYSKKHELNYRLLSGTDEVVTDYRTGGAAPVFFLLDREQKIRKVFTGYSEEVTNPEITAALNELL